MVERRTGAVSLQGGKLQLIRGAAKVLRKKLGLERALRGTGVGMVWLGEAHAVDPDASVVSGQLDWGVLTSWRNYVLKLRPRPRARSNWPTAPPRPAR